MFLYWGGNECQEIKYIYIYIYKTIYIYIYKTKKKKIRKGNSHLQEEERNVASIKYGSPEVLFL